MRTTRHNVNKKQSAKQFKRESKTVAAANLNITPMRGGWRL